MDIQYQSTPPKRSVQGSFKKEEGFSTPPKTQPNPQSKKMGEIQNSTTKFKLTPISALKRTPKLQREITKFNISRIDQDYIILKYLGEGCFSSVSLCQSRLTGDLVAIKQAKTSSMSLNQVQALGTLSIFGEKSKNIVRYYHSWLEEGTMYIVMEYCEKNISSIFSEYRKQGKHIPEKQIREILKQCLQGLKCMHDNQIVHLDIKPQNLLIKDNIVKIADLGLCRVSRINKYSDLEEGDSRYLAKEVLNFTQGVDLTKADIYSLGVSIYEGISLQNLPNNGQKWVAMRQYGLDLSPYSDLYSPQLLSIILLMTMVNWKDRPSAQQILNMDYMKQKQSKRQNMIMQAQIKRRNKEQPSL